MSIFVSKVRILNLTVKDVTVFVLINVIPFSSASHLFLRRFWWFDTFLFRRFQMSCPPVGQGVDLLFCADQTSRIEASMGGLIGFGSAVARYSSFGSRGSWLGSLESCGKMSILLLLIVFEYFPLVWVTNGKKIVVAVWASPVGSVGWD